MDRTRKIVVTIGVLLGVFLLAVLDCQFGGLRFASRAANVTVALLITWLPMACVVLLLRQPRSRARGWALAGLIPAACLSLLVGTLACLVQGVILYLPQASIQLGPSKINTYLSDAGAWDSGDTIVQQEITLLPGLQLVKPIVEHEATSDVKITVLDRHHVWYDITPGKYGYDSDTEAKHGVVWVF
jgi:hypothetical protein